MLPAGEMWSVVTESPSSARARAPLNVRQRRRFRRHVRRRTAALECRWSSRIPLVHVAIGDRNGVPRPRLPSNTARTALGTCSGVSDAGDGLLDFFLASARCRAGKPAGRPCRCRGFVDQVDVHRAGQRIRHDQRRRRQVVGLDQRVDRGLRSCGCRSAPPPRPDRLRRWRRSTSPAADRCCRYRWCSRSRRRGSPAVPGTAAGRPYPNSR